MRKTLLAAVASAPLWLLASQSPAAAQTSIGNSTSTPQTTAADGDITITTGGTISPNAANTAGATLNSNNSVINDGSISYKDINDAVGIAAQGGFTGSITNAGTITLSESYTTQDSNKDGVNETPFASLTSAGRYGIRLTGTSALVGDVFNTGAIAIQGDTSYGISLEAPLTGNLTNSGTITLTGDNGAALQETAGVSGNVDISGAITVTGQNSAGAVLSGTVGGRVSLYSAITTTDYGTTTRTTSTTLLNTIQNTANTSINEVNPNAGSGMVVSGSVAGGIFLSGTPANTNATDTTTDVDGDGTIDGGQVAGSITTYGAAPALIISGTNTPTGANNIIIGGFVSNPVLPAGSSAISYNGYGVVIGGTVDGFGIYDTVPATALQIGGLGGATNVAGGLLVTGTIEASAYAANALAIHIGAGATLPALVNYGSITATVLPPNTTTNTIPTFNGAATAIQIDGASTTLAGGQVTSLVNNGTISADVTAVTGGTVSATAVADRGGGITSVTNTGTISAQLISDTTGVTLTGTGVALANGNTTQNTSGTVALDLSANTTGTTLTQSQAPTEIVATTTTNGVATSVLTYQTPTTISQSTAATSSTVTNGSTTTVTTIPASPAITGDIYLGNGANTVNILAGTVNGALSMGSGPTGSVTIDNGAIYYGAFTYTGNALALNVNNGSFDNSSASASAVAGSNVAYKLSSLNVGSTGVLYFGVDPANNRAAQFLVSGTATIASGAQIGLTFVSNATGAQTYTLVQAGTLNIGSTTALTGPVPYIFDATITPNAAAGTITLEVQPKTAAELGLNRSQAAALPATYQALTQDPAVQAQFLGQYTKSGFLGLYNQILPDYAGGTFQAANAASLAIGRATSDSNDIENPTGSRGAWMQEIFVGVNQGAGQTDGFRGGGVGFVGGVETGGLGLGAFGLTTAFVTTSIADQHLPGDTQTAMSELELGGYWQGEFDGLTADARVGAGYTWMAGRRELVETDATTGDITLDRKVKSNWDGYTLSGRFGLAYKWSFNKHILGGGWFVQPQAHLDYFRLAENAYHDDEAEGGPALAMAFQSRTGQETSGTATITIGRQLGTGLVWRPQVEFGVRDVFTGNAGDTTARFESPTTGGPTGPSFTLTPADITGAAGIARFKIKASSEYYELGVEAGGEVLSSRYQEGDVKASIRVLF